MRLGEAGRLLHQCPRPAQARRLAGVDREPAAGLERQQRQQAQERAAQPARGQARQQGGRGQREGQPREHAEIPVAMHAESARGRGQQPQQRDQGGGAHQQQPRLGARQRPAQGGASHQPGCETGERGDQRQLVEPVAGRHRARGAQDGIKDLARIHAQLPPADAERQRRRRECRREGRRLEQAGAGLRPVARERGAEDPPGERQQHDQGQAVGQEQRQPRGRHAHGLARTVQGPQHLGPPPRRGGEQQSGRLGVARERLERPAHHHRRAQGETRVRGRGEPAHRAPRAGQVEAGERERDQRDRLGERGPEPAQRDRAQEVHRDVEGIRVQARGPLAERRGDQVGGEDRHRPQAQLGIAQEMDALAQREGDRQRRRQGQRRRQRPRAHAQQDEAEGRERRQRQRAARTLWQRAEPVHRPEPVAGRRGDQEQRRPRRQEPRAGPGERGRLAGRAGGSRRSGAAFVALGGSRACLQCPPRRLLARGSSPPVGAKLARPSTSS